MLSALLNKTFLAMRGLCFRTRSCARSSRRRARWRMCTATCSTTSSSTWTSTAPTTSCCARSTASRWSRSGCQNTGSIPTTCDVIATSSSWHWVPKHWLDPNYMWRHRQTSRHWVPKQWLDPNYVWRRRHGTQCQNSDSIPNYMWRHRLGTGCQNSGSIKITCDVVVVMAPSAETVARSQLHVMSSQHRVHIGNLTVIKFQWMWTALLFSRECR